MKKLIFAKHEVVHLKKHPEFDEQWLKNLIITDTSILGLGALEVKDVERIQPKAGRIDLLLYDRDNDKRYTVEIMLGKIDESHIIRAIEYWDLERKRIFDSDHCAVVIAEDITTRFLNIINLFNNQIPMIAIQLNALAIDDKLVLNFVKILDEVTVGEDEDEIYIKKDKGFWENKTDKKVMLLVDSLGQLLKEIDLDLSLSYTQSYIGIVKRNRPQNFVVLIPKKNFIRAEIKVENIEDWKQKLEENDIQIISVSKRSGRLKFRISQNDLTTNKELIKEILSVSYSEWNS